MINAKFISESCELPPTSHDMNFKRFPRTQFPAEKMPLNDIIMNLGVGGIENNYLLAVKNTMLLHQD